jgi:uncharacterized membrane protein
MTILLIKYLSPKCIIINNNVSSFKKEGGKYLKLKNLVITGIMVALIFVLTFAIKVPVPFTRGYIHLGDSMIFIAAILFGWRVGALAGGLGSALADVVGGYAFWAIPTFIIKGIMGALVGLISDTYRKKYSLKKEIGIFSVSVGVWSAFIISVSITLTSLINNLHTSSMTATLMNELGYDNLEDLKNFLLNTRNIINIVLIVVPVVFILISLILRKKDLKLFNLGNLMGSLISGLWMVFGYFIAGRILLGNWIIPIFEIPWNILQFTVGMIIAYIVLLAFKNTTLFQNSDL